MHSAQLQARHDTRYTSVIDAFFLANATEAGLVAFKGDMWTTRQNVIEMDLPVLASAQYVFNQSAEAILEVDDSLVHAIQRDRSLTVRVAATQPARADAALRRLRQVFPPSETEDRDVELRFWWYSNSRPTNTSHAVAVDRWKDISANYARAARDAVARLNGVRPPLEQGRLILFHGPPGTGKSHAVLALAAAWREWATFELVSDPERLFADPAYMLGVIAAGQSEDRTRERWQVLVLEDTGEFLTPYAKVENGQALSRLLNLSDGALGAATRTVLLCTTNEQLRDLHPAVSRPGRCLTQIEFPALSVEEAGAWCARNSVAWEPTTPLTIAELYARRAGSQVPSVHRAIGFAA